MSLYNEQFLDFNNILYYNDNMLKDSLRKFKLNPTMSNARDFISRYFEAGNKEKVFFLDFKDKYLKKGKHLHTVSLYLLGCQLAKLIDELVKNHFESLIGKEDEWYDFKYTWFLTALYHDVGCVIENDSLMIGSCERFKSLEHHLGKHGVKYNVYQYMDSVYWSQIIGYNNAQNNTKRCYFTFPELLIKNYFYYRADNMNAIDHGILTGYIMFDKLIENYEEAWLNASRIENEKNFRKFTYSGLSWRVEHQAHFACIANSIMAHNIWFGKEADEQKYKIYGLDAIISSEDIKLKIEHWPLAYFLDILDTIEPVKRFTRIDPITVWKSIDIKLEKDSIVISNIGDVLKQEKDEYDKWINAIYSLTDWLSIEIYPERKEEVIHSITLTPIYEQNNNVIKKERK